MSLPEVRFHFEAPSEVPLLQPFHVSGWIASRAVVQAVRGQGNGEWLTLVDRPDVRTAYPDFPHVVGFAGQVSLQSVRDDKVSLVARVGGGEQTISASLPPVPLPPEHLQIRQVGGVWGRAFLTEGRELFDRIHAALADAGCDLARAQRILDFGCGCGRVLWMFKHLPHAGDVWGCDIDAEAIEWNTAHLGAIARFRCNPSLPPAPFPDGFFDALYSVSVFTHLPEAMQFAWLAELRRVVRPGGVLLVSLHGEHYWGADPGVREEVEQAGFAYRTGPRTEGLPDFYMVAFHAEAYIRREWARYFDVLEIRPRYLHGAHDVALLRRRAD
jgi:SAM-dependent methyltransferase